MKNAVFPAFIALLCSASAWGKPASAKPARSTSAESFSVSTAAPRNVEELMAHFAEIDRQLTSLSAKFSQSLEMSDAGMAQTVEGTLEYSKPDRLRVQHDRPNRQLFITDGDKVWIHRIDQNQVIESSLREWKKSDPLLNNLLDFGNYARLLQRYDVSFDARTLEATLRPKENTSQPFTLKLKLSGPHLFPTQTELEVGTTRVRTELRELRFNSSLAAADFRFVVPQGAQVFENFKPPVLGQDSKK